MQQGKIITLSGISGIGKSYLKSYILSHNPDMQSLISVTTRKRRDNEVDEIDKFFFTLEEFKKADYMGELCVINQVFDNWYAYKKSQVDLCDAGVSLITELFYKNVVEFKNDFKNTITVNVNRKMYKFLNLFMYKIMHKKFHVLSESNSNLSFNRYEFPVIFII